MKNCKFCQVQFEITQEDLNFYDKISPTFNGVKYSIPEPTLCPDCRQQRRLAWINEHNLYYRKCDGTGKQILSWVSPDKPTKVYDKDYWWSDDWDQYATGMDYDFSKSFLSQFKELLHSAPIMSLLVSNNENSDYVNLETDDKNCYMNFGGHYNEDSYHNTYAIYTKNCVDNYWAWKCELLYESVESYTCYSSAYLENCNNCNDCYFGYDLKSCKNCIGCVGLRHKEFYIFNKPYSKKEFDDVKEKLKSYKFLKEFQAKFEKFSLSVPRKYAQLENCEDCSGDYMKGSKSLL